MLKAALHRDAVTGQKRQLCRAVRKAFERGKPVDRRNLADSVHLGVDIERRQSGRALRKVGDALTELLTNVA